jgi:hypothetical protein
MTLAKFIALLDTRSLFFCRLDCLGDEYEGVLPRRRRREPSTPTIEAEEARRLRMSCFVNCWNMSDEESEALWRLYGAQDASVAIRSTYESLIDVVRQNEGVYLGLIHYGNDDTNCIGTDCLSPIMRKRLAFRHEEEVRFVRVVKAAGEEPTGIDIPVDLDRLIRGVYIDPYAPEWFENVVRAVVFRFAPALKQRVTWSSIKGHPLY